MPHIARILLVAAFAAIPLATVASAQSFDELEARLKSHPSLSALGYDAEANRERAIAATALPDPVVSLGINNFPIFDPSFDTYLPTNKAVGIRQQIPNLAGRQARAGEARAMSVQTEAIRNARYAALRAELIALLADKRRITRQKTLAEARDAKYDELVDIVEAEIDAGRPAVYRLAEIESERAEVSRTLVDLDQQEAETDALLVELVGLVPSTSAPPLNEKDWSGAALEFHNVRVADAAVRVTNYGVDEARSAWKPEWGAQLTYQQRDEGAMFAGDDWVSGMVTFTVPLWAERKQAPNLRAAKAERAGAEQRYQAAARNAAAQYASRDAIIRSADDSINVLQVKIAAVEDEVEAQLITYESGVGGYAPIIDGEIAILKLRAEIEAETARKAASIARLNALLVTQ
ncbi:transporter [Henriciella barbarensis]|uniref:Transporter n=1 Tax=Henriciella barbarensis TaxID=86342 RepID=A0A399QTE5_9PROT|nr:TolC family protein [Henriciella barbarensis]RIJ20792.1 transporter [Henriciella barbarensis]RIJ20817.1 transporter [Henriciella barbarensis]RIJ22485.1 transporter [Henriciella barbarensis]RIJ24678.1 transporter [Henriciella barbarensis]